MLAVRICTYITVWFVEHDINIAKRLDSYPVECNDILFAFNFKFVVNDDIAVDFNTLCFDKFTRVRTTVLGIIADELVYSQMRSRLRRWFCACDTLVAKATPES